MASSHSRNNLATKNEEHKMSRSNSIRSIDSKASEPEYGAIKALALKSRMLGQIASASFNENDSYEPLPISDYSLFEEKKDIKSLDININPFATKKCYFIPNTPITIKVTPKRKSRHHIFYPYK